MRAVAITNEHTECECCGRSGLKRTVVLETESGVQFYGIVCAARALGRAATTPTQARKSIEAEIATQARKDRDAKLTALIEASDSLAELLGWNYRPSDRWDSFAANWLSHGATKFAERATGEAKRIVDTMLELRKVLK